MTVILAVIINKGDKMRRKIALFLAFAMMLSLMPLNVFARPVGSGFSVPTIPRGHGDRSIIVVRPGTFGNFFEIVGSTNAGRPNQMGGRQRDGTGFSRNIVFNTHDFTIAANQRTVSVATFELENAHWLGRSSSPHVPNVQPPLTGFRAAADVAALHAFLEEGAMQVAASGGSFETVSTIEALLDTRLFQEVGWNSDVTVDSSILGGATTFSSPLSIENTDEVTPVALDMLFEPASTNSEMLANINLVMSHGARIRLASGIEGYFLGAFYSRHGVNPGDTNAEISVMLLQDVNSFNRATAVVLAEYDGSTIAGGTGLIPFHTSVLLPVEYATATQYDNVYLNIIPQSGLFEQQRIALAWRVDRYWGRFHIYYDGNVRDFEDYIHIDRIRIQELALDAFNRDEGWNVTLTLPAGFTWADSSTDHVIARALGEAGAREDFPLPTGFIPGGTNPSSMLPPFTQNSEHIADRGNRFLNVTTQWGTGMNGLSIRHSHGRSSIANRVGNDYDWDDGWGFFDWRNEAGESGIYLPHISDDGRTLSFSFDLWNTRSLVRILDRLQVEDLRINAGNNAHYGDVQVHVELKRLEASVGVGTAAHHHRTVASETITVAYHLGGEPLTYTPDFSLTSGRVRFGEHYFQLIDAGVSWDDARAHAQSLGGDLAVIRNAETQAFIESLLAQGNKYAYWLGGYSPYGYDFYWITGEPMNFTNWGPDQPDGGSYYEDVLMISRVDIWRVPQFTWNDNVRNPEINWDYALGRQALGFIVEWTVDAIVTPPLPPQPPIPPIIPPRPPTGGGTWTGTQGGGGTTSTPSAPRSTRITSVRVPVSGGNAIRTTVSNNQATLNLPQRTINQLISNAVDNTVTFDFSEAENLSAVRIRRTNLTAFAEAGLAVQIMLPLGSVTLNSNALASTLHQGNDAFITVGISVAPSPSLTVPQRREIGRNEQAFRVSVRRGTTPITSFDESLSVTFPTAAISPRQYGI